MFRELDELYVKARTGIDVLAIEFKKLEPKSVSATTLVVQPQVFKPVPQLLQPPVAFESPVFPPPSIEQTAEASLTLSPTIVESTPPVTKIQPQARPQSPSSVVFAQGPPLAPPSVQPPQGSSVVPKTQQALYVVVDSERVVDRIQQYITSWAAVYPVFENLGLGHADWKTLYAVGREGIPPGTDVVYVFTMPTGTTLTAEKLAENAQIILKAQPANVLFLYIYFVLPAGYDSAHYAAQHHWLDLDEKIRAKSNFAGVKLEIAPTTRGAVKKTPENAAQNRAGIAALDDWLTNPRPATSLSKPVSSAKEAVQQLPSTSVTPEVQLLPSQGFPAAPPQVLPSLTSVAPPTQVVVSATQPVPVHGPPSTTVTPETQLLPSQGLPAAPQQSGSAVTAPIPFVAPPAPVSAASAPFVVVTRAVDQEYMKSMLQIWLKHDPVSFASLRNVQWVTLDKVNDDAVKHRNTIFAFHVGDISKLEVGPVIRDAQSVWVHQPAKKLLMLYVIEANDIATVPQVQAEKHWTQLGPTTQSKTAVVGIEVNRTKQDRNKAGLDMLQKWIAEAMREPVQYVYNPAVVYIPTGTPSKVFESEVFSDPTLTHLHALKSAPATTAIGENQIIVVLMHMPANKEESSFNGLKEWLRTHVIPYRPRIVLLLVLFDNKGSRAEIKEFSIPLDKVRLYDFVKGRNNEMQRSYVNEQLANLEFTTSEF